METCSHLQPPEYAIQPAEGQVRPENHLGTNQFGNCLVHVWLRGAPREFQSGMPL